MIAALFVQTNGCYYGLPDVDPWDEARDARLYAGPWPVVAHPPCQRWGRYWSGGPNPNAQRRAKGDDDGCFASALASVRRWGGVLEHPAASHAWAAHGLLRPMRRGWPRGWRVADHVGGWTCEVEQGHYGHRARKATWLYVNATALPPLNWRISKGARIDEGFHSSAERVAARAQGVRPCQRLGHRERAATPTEFRDLLLLMARSAANDNGAA